MLLYDLGRVAWEHSQLVYHALAELGREALVLCAPDRPYVCLGYHQDARLELDLDHCQATGLPVFRREVGGGAVYLDPDQTFWQLVISPDNPAAPRRRDVFYRKFLGPVAAAYQALGVASEFQPVNDLVVAGRKICGTGAGEVGSCWVFVGNLMRRFDQAAMARVCRCPDEAFRARFARAMAGHLTSLERELGAERAAAVSDAGLRQALAREFGAVLGPLTPARPDPELWAEVERQGQRMLSPEWLIFPRKPRPGRTVKVRAGVFLCRRELDTAAGRLRLDYLLRDERLTEVELRAEDGAETGPELSALARAWEGRGLTELAETLAASWPTSLGPLPEPAALARRLAA